MSLAHQEKIKKSLKATRPLPLPLNSLPTPLDSWDSTLKVKLQWIHNVSEHKLKNEFSKGHILLKEKEEINGKLKRASQELEGLQQEDGVGVVKKLLVTSQSLTNVGGSGVKSRKLERVIIFYRAFVFFR